MKKKTKDIMIRIPRGLKELYDLYVQAWRPVGINSGLDYIRYVLTKHGEELETKMGKIGSVRNEPLILGMLWSITVKDDAIPEIFIANEIGGPRIYLKEMIKKAEILDYKSIENLSLKSLMLLRGEYENGDGNPKKVKYFGILPLPEIKMVALAYFFLITGEKGGDSVSESTICILTNEKNKDFFYQYIKQFKAIIEEEADKITLQMPRDQTRNVMLDIMKNLNKLAEQVSLPGN
ncbi:MAG: hypothetical protein ACFFCS_13440 [Candidatus Hodarchaeota archaeon]